jgi:hypothetical protein
VDSHGSRICICKPFISKAYLNEIGSRYNKRQPFAIMVEPWDDDI